MCFTFVICFRAESRKIRQRRCGFVWQWICCRFVVLLDSVCHENGLKYREERIPEISNLWFSLKLPKTTYVVSFQTTIPSPVPLSVSLSLSHPLSLYPSVGHQNYTVQNKPNIKHYIEISRSTENPEVGRHIFHTSYSFQLFVTVALAWVLTISFWRC